MRRYRHPLTFVFCASLFIALGSHAGTGRWYVPAVAVFVASGLALTALVIRRGGTQ